MLVSVLIMLALLALLGLFYELQYNYIGSCSFLTETGLYQLYSLESGRCFQDELMSWPAAGR